MPPGLAPRMRRDEIEPVFAAEKRRVWVRRGIRAAESAMPSRVDIGRVGDDQVV